MQSEQKYEALIANLEAEAGRAPRRYRFRLAVLAAVGFLVLGGSVLLALGISVGLVLLLMALSPLLLVKLIKVIWIPIAFGWMILRALWVKFDPPEGHRLMPGEAPALEAEVERLRRATRAPRLDGIVIAPDMNAGAMSLPRALGLLGQRHYLVVGLPLMRALSPEQLSGVIAHEFGHFGGGHARFAGWVYHVRVSWMRVMYALSMQKAMLAGLFSRFFRWYAPYFNAYSFVLARDNEYEADAAAAKVVGAATMGASLVRTELSARHLQEDFWPAVQRSVSTADRPPAALYADMANSLATARASDMQRLHEALARRPGYDDTHPTLHQRLQRLGADAALPPAPATTAADVWLGPLLPTLEAEFSAHWHDQVAETWGREHAISSEARARLEALDAEGPRSPEERLEYARLIERERPGTDALPLYRAALDTIPDNAFAHFRVGALLLERKDDAGVSFLRRAMELDASATKAVCELLYLHYREIGDDAGRAWVEKTMEGLMQQHGQAMQARQSVSADDTFIDHGLGAAEVRTACDGLRATGKVKQAWLVRKSLHDPDPDAPPHFMVLVELRGFVLDADVTLQRVIDALELPGTCAIVTVKHDRKLTRRIQQIASAPVYVHGR
jgi:Zn-dependent protease with chaperone function